MAERFTGTFEELREKLAPIAGVWKDLNPNQKQFRAESGGILNWYPATGSLMFQGKPPAADELRSAISAALNIDPTHAAATFTAAPPTRRTAVIQPPGLDNKIQLGSEPVGAEPDPTGGVLTKPFSDSELIFGLIGAVGTELEKVRMILEERLKVIGYVVTQIRVTKDVIPQIVPVAGVATDNEFERIKFLMDAGNDARRQSRDNSILALGAVAVINSRRGRTDGYPQHEPKRAYIVSSLKHPDEVARFREIYPQAFYLIGVHADERRRFDYLTKDKRISEADANVLIARDEDEHLVYGQKVTDTFHLSDFFVRIDGQEDHLKNSLWRILDLLFGHPYVTPTFDEYAMFLAFAASLRSADLSRQVGAVVAIDDQVVATGANDCPKAGGGLYWPRYDKNTQTIEDEQDGRDYMRGEDSNRIEQQKIIDEIVAKAKVQGLDPAKVAEILEASRVRDLTEFGRVVHAEMEALLSCARARLPVKGGTVYSTTFPCHNCAKHIVAAGIDRVVFIEPYQKSMAAKFHTDSIHVGFTTTVAESGKRKTVRFEPFVGVGPRRFFDLFSVRLGSGYPLKRKDLNGRRLDWKPEQGRLRLQMLPVSYLDLELLAGDMFNEAAKNLKEYSHGI